MFNKNRKNRVMNTWSVYNYYKILMYRITKIRCRNCCCVYNWISTIKV